MDVCGSLLASRKGMGLPVCTHFMVPSQLGAALFSRVAMGMRLTVDKGGVMSSVCIRSVGA